MNPRPPILAAVILALAQAGCSAPTFHVGGQTTAEAESGRLRAADAKLREELAAVKARLAASETEAAALRRSPGGAKPAEGVVIPMATSLELGGLSGPVNTDKNASINAEAKGLFDTLRLYARPYDQEHRLIPVTGRAMAQIVASTAGDKPEKVLASKSWDLKAFGAAWRDNLAGTHYALEMPLPKDLPAAWRVRVVVEDLSTGNRLRAEAKFPR